MVDNFFQKAREFFTGNNDNEFDQDSEYRDTDYGDGLRPTVGEREINSASQDPYGDPADQDYGNFTPGNQDPYGDPANEYYGNLTPASQDPYGDPADQNYGDISPASEDPYGDPADEYGYGR